MDGFKEWEAGELNKSLGVWYEYFKQSHKMQNRQLDTNKTEKHLEKASRSKGRGRGADQQ
ncbi:MAG: hypothetical protein E3K36_11380 [Candidatus Brocadia sp.]|nr:hypothetical protein [Candidatus Brocadia sp.]